MDARCISCSGRIDFKAYKGARLKDRKCSCGGSYEMISYVKSINEQSPLGIESTNVYGEGDMWYGVYKNRKGILFIRDKPNKRFVELPNSLVAAQVCDATGAKQQQLAEYEKNKSKNKRPNGIQSNKRNPHTEDAGQLSTH